MSNKILILGNSGSGKSSSIRNLNPKETFVIKCLEKDLPFKGSRKTYSVKNKNTHFVNEPVKIISGLKRINDNKDIKTVIIDDANYILTYEYKRKATEKGFGKFEVMAFEFMDILEYIDTMRDDINVYIMAHTEKDNDGVQAFKTIGRFLSEKLVVEGLFTIVLLAGGGEHDYKFITNGITPAKSPMEMFDDTTIENDLALINKAIKEYYE